MYRSLNAETIVKTIDQLHRRIGERFPGSGLSKVSAELLQVGREAQSRAEEIRKPHIPIRIGVAILILLIVTVLVFTVIEFDFNSEELGLGELLQLSDSAFNDFVLLGALTLFLVTLERRWRRKQVLQSIHELRSLAHVVDMHQLKVDPQQAFGSERVNTPSSPERRLSPYELSRYLDYSSQMFSLIGKVAALFVQGFDDAAVITSVNDVDTLTTGLSSKVWQKMVILHSLKSGLQPLGSQET